LAGGGRVGKKNRGNKDKKFKVRGKECQLLALSVLKGTKF